MPVLALLGATAAVLPAGRAFAQPPLVAQARPVARDARGLAVLALGAPSEAATELARETSADNSLRSASDARARVLLGEPVPSGAPREVVDLADLRAAVKGDDVASRQILAAIALKLGVRGIVVVEETPGKAPSARLFLAESGEMDAARYEPDTGSSPIAWSATVRSLARALGTTVLPEPVPGATPSATAGAATSPFSVREGPRIDNTPPSHRMFYESPWFWGAIGAAAFAAVGIFFATRDNSTNTIHLQLQVPH
jgi:hypothetical protein